MTQQANVVRDGVERLQTTARRMERELRRLGRRLSSRRRALEKQARRSVARARSDLRRSPLFRRAETLRKEAGRQLEGLLEILPIATKGEVARIDRKVAQLNRKLRDLERGRTNRAAATAPPPAA